MLVGRSTGLYASAFLTSSTVSIFLNPESLLNKYYNQDVAKKPAIQESTLLVDGRHWLTPITSTIRGLVIVYLAQPGFDVKASYLAPHYS